jgi:prepilin-type processing-associated H-X9-DG protein
MMYEKEVTYLNGGNGFPNWDAGSTSSTPSLDPFGNQIFLSDGASPAWTTFNDWGFWGVCDFLSGRHDPAYRQPDPVRNNNYRNYYAAPPRPGLRGNVAFCDGSVRYITRGEMAKRTCWDPLMP